MFRSRRVSGWVGVGAIATAVAVTVSVTPFATAASSTVVEAESMSVSPSFGGAISLDSAASGGSSMVLTWTSTASKNVSLPASATVVVQAKGQQCNGAPSMAIKVDGVTIGTHTVSATSWTSYTSSRKISAGSHTIRVSFTNQYQTLKCARRLSVDAVTVVPEVTVPTTATSPTTTTPSTPPTSSTTSTAPTTTTTSVPAATAPKGNLPGWTHAFADDFTRSAPKGSWANDTDPYKVVYVGAEGQQWRTYPSTFLDTYQRRPYRPAEVLSVADGMLQFDLHNVQGQPAGANPSPIIANGSQYQTYGRYSARLRVDNPNLSEYHIAWLLWPQSEKWPADGEIDFPEGRLSETAGAYHHYALASGGQDTADTGVTFNNWHVYTIEWSPGRVRFLLDDAVVLDTTRYVPTKPMRWQLQTETNGFGTHRGNLLVDWVSIWSYAGS